ncbi:MAG: S-layer homology domain-containing protein, partial [Clostridia bacterium]|nr:S-layer homology domain-containing protein [Clostridia bacterium]
YNKHLYDIGDGYYYAVQEVVWFNSAYEEFDTSVYAYIIKKNNDGSYRLIRTYKKGELLSQKDIDELVNPSDWAVDELGKAEKAGLAPKLDGEPFMTESATRLQFAQLAVSLAEKATGKSLASAPDTTFKDCEDIAVLKAYKAGIINGTSETEFSPHARLTREQLAAMIWRTVKYIQSETKKEKLTGGGDISSYADAYDVSDYAAEAVAALSKNGIMKGTSETELSPKGNCSVEQSIILIYRTYLKIK